jgi:hypothetical protein
MDKYLEQCKNLSLTARMAIALLVFERFCEENQIGLDQVGELSEYLWQWPLIDGPDQFEPWESSRPELVNYGLGDGPSKDVLSVLDAVQIEESRFRNIVGGLVEILWGSFWGAAENELSFEALSTVLSSSKLEVFPTLTPFKFSRYSDLDGWGVKITKEDRDFWRGSYKNA